MMTEAWTKPINVEILDYGQRPDGHGWVRVRQEITRETCGGQFNCDECAKEFEKYDSEQRRKAKIAHEACKRAEKRPNRAAPTWIWLRDRLKEIERSKADFAFKGKKYPPEYDEEIDSIKPILEDIQRIMKEKNKKERERIRLRRKLREVDI